MQQRIAFSDDGLHWQDQPENPAFKGRSDTFNNIVYNPERDMFMHYRRATVNRVVLSYPIRRSIHHDICCDPPAGIPPGHPYV